MSLDISKYSKFCDFKTKTIDEIRTGKQVWYRISDVTEE